MKALWLEDGTLRIRDDIPDPRPPPNEALVHVLQAGICNTDLEMVRGYYPFTGILGHEFVGEVIEAADRPALVGKRVVGEINATCGACSACQSDRPTHCHERTVLGIKGRQGAFAELLIIPTDNLHEIPASISNDEAVFTEPLAAALEVTEQVTIGPSQRVVVVGAGKLGSLVVQTVARTGADLTVVTRTGTEPEHLGGRATRFAAPDAVPTRTADVVVECTGNPDGLTGALRYVRPRGTVVLKSTYRGTAELDMSRIVVDEITLVGSRCGPFGEALDLLVRRDIDVVGMIQGRYALSDAEAAFEHAALPGTLKVLIVM